MTDAEMDMSEGESLADWMERLRLQAEQEWIDKGCPKLYRLNLKDQSKETPAVRKVLDALEDELEADYKRSLFELAVYGNAVIHESVNEGGESDDG